MGEFRQPCPMFEHFHQPGFIENRIGIRRTGEVGDAARCRCRHFRFQGRPVFEAGFAQPRRQVDQAWCDDAAAGVDHPFGLEAGRGGADGGDTAVGNEDIGGAVHGAGWVDDAAVLDLDAHGQAPASIDMTAIRTAMPKVTCGKMTA